jgi:hypothetical protein
MWAKQKTVEARLDPHCTDIRVGVRGGLEEAEYFAAVRILGSDGVPEQADFDVAGVLPAADFDALKRIIDQLQTAALVKLGYAATQE